MELHSLKALGVSKKIQITYATKDGKLVFIDNVGNGLACGCKCTKCGESLVTKNKGKIKEHHFAHAIDSDCNGESLKHYMAKKEIEEWEALNLPALPPRPRTFGFSYQDYPRYQMVTFEKVELEKRIGDSKYFADVICTTSNGKQLVIEIVVTHKLGKAKEQYLQYNKITTLLIDVNKWNHHTKSLNTYMLKGNNRWVYNPKIPYEPSLWSAKTDVVYKGIKGFNGLRSHWKKYEEIKPKPIKAYKSHNPYHWKTDSDLPDDEDLPMSVKISKNQWQKLNLETKPHSPAK